MAFSLLFFTPDSAHCSFPQFTLQHHHLDIMVRALKKVAKNKTEIGLELLKNKCFGVVSDANFVNVNFVFLPLMSN